MRKTTQLFVLLTTIVIIFQSCYSVRLRSSSTMWTEGENLTEDGFWRNKEMIVIDTTVKIGLIKNSASVDSLCPNGFYSIEYRVTLGHVLLSGITLGKHRRIKLKCNCIKPSNEY